MSFWQYLIKRILYAIPVLLGVSIIVFSLIHLIPGDPATAVLGEVATPEAVQALREAWHLNDPLYKQYALWLWDILHGDLGKSLHTRQPVAEILISRLPVTIILTLISMIVSLVIAIPTGIVSAIKQNSTWDHLSRVLALAGISIPNFWLGIVFIIIFAVYLRWLPPGGFHFQAGLWAGLKGMILPAGALGAAYAAITMRMIRSSMLEVLRQEYIKTARAKGLAESQVICKHSIKNAIIPTITVIGMQVGYLLSGAVLTETIFFMPGIGRELVTALNKRDYPIIQGLILFFAVSFVVTSIIVDLSYAFLNPKIKYS